MRNHNIYHHIKGSQKKDCLSYIFSVSENTKIIHLIMMIWLFIVSNYKLASGPPKDPGGSKKMVKVKSMMEKSNNTLPNRKEKSDICKICGKEGQWVAIRDHIEAKHLEGISLPCNTCGNVFRSRSQLRKHRCSYDTQK